MKTSLSIALSVALSLLIFLAGCHLVPSALTAPAEVTALEYRVDQVKFQYDPPTGLQDHLNHMAKDGWRLVQFVEHEDWYRVVMSRPAKG